jgi:ABC-type transport system involved in multi-copper enzyme maturation permease subunit
LNPQLRKEIRGLLPAALAALTIPIGIQLCLGHTHHVANDGIPIFALFVAFLAASSFGPEVSQGTLTSLLVQPLSRVNLWNYKLAVLAVGVRGWRVYPSGGANRSRTGSTPDRA